MKADSTLPAYLTTEIGDTARWRIKILPAVSLKNFCFNFQVLILELFRISNTYQICVITLKMHFPSISVTDLPSLKSSDNIIKIIKRQEVITPAF